MPKSCTIRLLGTAVACLLGYGCGDPVDLPAVREMPFDPSGSWQAQVEGLVSGSQVDGPMVITLSVVAPNTANFNSVDLTGSWHWGGLEGIVDGFWAPFMVTHPQTLGCPALEHNCSLLLHLLPPPNSCPEPLSPFGGNTIYLVGWFGGGSATLVGASLEGTYWEGAGRSVPCSGPVLISLDTDASFDRN